MDTSDSECFESADEDFHSDEEVTQVERRLANVTVSSGETSFQEASQDSPTAPAINRDEGSSRPSATFQDSLITANVIKSSNVKVSSRETGFQEASKDSPATPDMKKVIETRNMEVFSNETSFQEASHDSPTIPGVTKDVETSQCNIRTSALIDNTECSSANRNTNSTICISNVVKTPITSDNPKKSCVHSNEDLLISTNKSKTSSLQAQTKKLPIVTNEQEGSSLQAQTKKLFVNTNKGESSPSPDQTKTLPTNITGNKNLSPKDQTKNLPISTNNSEGSSWQDGWDVEEDNLWDQDEINWTPQGDPVKSLPPEEKTPDMWENDKWETIEEPAESVPTPWGNWGFTSLLSTATHLTSQVSQGISNVLETGMGIPDPEELAKIDSLEERQSQDHTSNEIPSSSFSFGDLVSGVTNITKFVESTGTKVISGGLDTLETIGKKTMEVLQEGDPGLKKKRALLKLEPDKPILSQVLREAKESAEKKSRSQTEVVRRRPNYEMLFDDHHGLVHLEALEMVSKQCEIRLKRLIESSSPETLTEIQETMDQVKELCELPEEEEDEQLTVEEIREKLESAVKELNVNITYKCLISTWEETEEWLGNLKLDTCDESELHQQAIKTLAQITALAVEQYHKAGELLLIKEHRSTADEADSLVQLTAALTSLIGNAAAKFSEKLNARLLQGYSNKEEVNSLITNVFYEAGNSSSYIQDAFHLLIPVLQAGAV